MDAARTLAVYATGLVVVLGAAVGVGRAVGPVGASAPTGHAEQAHAGQAHAEPAHAGEAHAGEAHAAEPAGVRPPGGLAVAQDGFRLALEPVRPVPGAATTLAFRVLDAEGRALTAYTRSHERDLHLIVVRRDGTGFQHLHPARDAAGRWSVPLTLPAAGAYKVFTDFTPAGREQPVVLATDLQVPGEVREVAQAAERRTSTGAGYTVTLEGDLVAGTSSRLVARVSRDGRPVTDLEPYLGAYGHLVALRAGDLAYVHVHAEERVQPDGSTVFSAEVPSAGGYRLYLDYQHDGVVRTADFATTATGGRS